MFSNTSGRMSVDSLSPTASTGPRGDFPFHRRQSRSPPRRPSTRRESTASSIHSVGGSLDTSSTTWASAVLESGQNAISTLLQPPIVRTGLLPHTIAPASSAHKPPTARDIPPVTLTNIPRVDASEFQSYLNQVGALHEQLRRVREDQDEGANVLHRSASKADDLSELLDEAYLKPGKQRASLSRKMSTASITSISSLEGPATLRRASSSFRRAATHGPPPLSTIPNVYFDEDFRLENPRTFDVVSERSEVVRPAPGTEDKVASNGHASAPRKALATNAILQEKLSWYMDTIEMHLIQSISTASTTFFTALGSLRELHTEAAESVERLKRLRKELEILDQEIATNGLQITEQRRKRENLEQLHDAIKQLREVVDGVAVCESLVDSGEVDQALDMINNLEQLIAGREDFSRKGRPRMRLRDLRGAVALQGVSGDLNSLRFRIGKAYENNFMSVLMGDLRRHVEHVSQQEVLMRWSSASNRVRGSHIREPSAFPSYMSSIDGLRVTLLSSLTGLQRAKYLTVAGTAYREAVLKEIRNIIKRPLPSSTDDDAESLRSSSTMTGGRQRTRQEHSSTLARNLRALEPKDAEELLVTIYIGVTETLRRLNSQVKVLLDVAYSIGDTSPEAGFKSPQLKSPPFSPLAQQVSDDALEAQAEIHKALDVPNLVGQAVDLAHDKIVRVLRVRSEQSTHLTLTWFLRYYTLNLHFANECESISGRSGSQLKTVVNGHIKSFVQQHGEAENQKLTRGMDSDQWNAVDFTEKDTQLLKQILESSTQDAAEWFEGTKVWIPCEDEDDEVQAIDELAPTQVNGSGSGSGSGKSKTRSAVIEEEVFMLPNSAVLCMDGMARFMHLVVGIPPMTSDVAASLITYLKMFNSRCTQLILGAGATKSAGLRNITTKHLALASQTLAFIAALIPHVREFVRRHCGSNAANVSSVLGEFDKVRRLYQEHQNNIYDKLVEIMSGRASAGARKMKEIKWDSPKQPAHHEHMETLAKETATLHRVLTKNLPEGTVRLIMVPVFQSYKDTFGSAFRTAESKTMAGRESMLRDVEFFTTRLGKIDGFGDAGDHLVGIINNREVDQPEVSAPAKASAPAEASTNGNENSTPAESTDTDASSQKQLNGTENGKASDGA